MARKKRAYSPDEHLETQKRPMVIDDDDDDAITTHIPPNRMGSTVDRENTASATPSASSATMMFTPSPPRPSPSAECTPPTTHIVPHLNVPSSASKSASQGLPRTPPPSTTNMDVNAVLYTLLRKLHTASQTRTAVYGIGKDKVSQYTQLFDANGGLAEATGFPRL